MAKIEIYEDCEFEVMGIHSNPNPPLTADIECVEHAHTFKFHCMRKLNAVPNSWSANNFREDCQSFIHDYFAEHRSYGVLNFERNDCIALAQLLMAKLGLDMCSVHEAGVGGIQLIRQPDLNHFDLEQSHLTKLRDM